MTRATETDIDTTTHLCPLLCIRGPRGFGRPDGWEYADHLIPEIYAEWLKYQYDHGVVKTEVKEENDEGET